MNVLLAFLLLGMGIAMEIGNAKAADEGACLTDQWIMEPKAFVLEVTKTSLPDVCIRIVSQQRLNLAVGLPSYDATEHAAAAFLPERAEIFLAEDLDFTDSVSRSYLVHELAHAQQFARGAPQTSKCQGLLENEAYALQARYLRRHRLKQEAFLFQMMGMLQGACGIDY
jgi:hypothetical protein